MNNKSKVKNLRLSSKGQLDKITGQIEDRDVDWVIDGLSGLIIINSGDNKILSEEDFRIELEVVLSSWEALRMLKDKDTNLCNNYTLYDRDGEFGKVRYEHRQITELTLH